jgi:lysophospholipase L1-like esterase
MRNDAQSTVPPFHTGKAAVLRICFVGDSFVNGTGDPACLGWAGRICARAWQRGHDITYYNLGVRRNTSKDIVQRWRTEVVSRLPLASEGRIIFSFGVNDVAEEAGAPRVALDQSAVNVQAILRGARELYPTLMIGPAPVSDAGQNARIATLSAVYAEICGALDVPYFDIYPHLSTSDVWQREVAAYDGAHPQTSGYEVYAQLVEAWPAWRAWLGEEGDMRATLADPNPWETDTLPGRTIRPRNSEE